MSDSDGDFSDELLELAGAGEKRRKKSASKQAKRRKAEWATSYIHCIKPTLMRSSRQSDPVEVASDNDYESEEGDSAPSYPLEGKFVDEADRQK